MQFYLQQIPSRFPLRNILTNNTNQQQFHLSKQRRSLKEPISQSKKQKYIDGNVFENSYTNNSSNYSWKLGNNHLQQHSIYENINFDGKFINSHSHNYIFKQDNTLSKPQFKSSLFNTKKQITSKSGYLPTFTLQYLNKEISNKQNQNRQIKDSIGKQNTTNANYKKKTQKTKLLIKKYSVEEKLNCSHNFKNSKNERQKYTLQSKFSPLYTPQISTLQRLNYLINNYRKYQLQNQKNQYSSISKNESRRFQRLDSDSARIKSIDSSELNQLNKYKDQNLTQIKKKKSTFFANKLEQKYQKIQQNNVFRGRNLTQISYLNNDCFKKKVNIKEKQQFVGKNNEIYKNGIKKQSLKMDDFIVIRQIGKGKYGNVYLVSHKQIIFTSAIKIIPKKLIKSQNLQNQIIRQLKIHSYVNHPNIVSLYGFFSDIQNFYILTQYCPDGQLYNLIKKYKSFEQNKVSYIIRQISQAVSYLHYNNILHRDIKPQNIIINHNIVKICDFGWSVYLNNEQLRQTRCGTPLYLSPQMLKGQNYDESVDIWTIGILTYQLLVGDIPFKIRNSSQLHKIISDKITFPVKTHCVVIKDFILRILEKKPEKRLSICQILNHKFLKRIQIMNNDVYFL